MAPSPPASRATTFKISGLVEQSGVGKELIHHYLREGLLPRPAARARYDHRHLRLLQLIKRLREERFLPLSVIRDVVRFNNYDPDQLELLLLAGGELTTAAGQGPSAHLPDESPMSLDDLEARTGVPRVTIERYVELGLLRATASSDGACFRRHDANLAALLRRGTEMGIPLESFRTIRSYVELAFELEQGLFLPQAMTERDLADTAREFALRKEVVNGFVVNVLTGLVNGLLYEFLDETAQRAELLTEVVYQPSDAFVRRHGIADDVVKMRKRLGRRPGNIELQRCLLRSLAFCGRYREAVFMAEHAQPKLARDAEIARIHGWSLFLHGEQERGTNALEAARVAHPDDVVTTVYLAAVRFSRLAEAGGVEATLRATQRVIHLVHEALDAIDAVPPAERAEVRLLGGWILTVLSGAHDLQDRGVRELERVFDDTGLGSPTPIEPESMRVRCRIAAAYLLFRALSRAEPNGKPLTTRLDALRAEVLCNDPACDFAMRLFLDPSTPQRGTS